MCLYFIFLFLSAVLLTAQSDCYSRTSLFRYIRLKWIVRRTKQVYKSESQLGGKRKKILFVNINIFEIL